MEKVEPKFEVGQLVSFVADKVDNPRLFITTVITETCMGGTQIIYTGRIYSDKGGSVNTVRFSEIELKEKPK